MVSVVMMTMVLEVMVVMGAMEATMTMGLDISGVGVLVAMGITIMIILVQGNTYIDLVHIFASFKVIHYEKKLLNWSNLV